MSSLVPVRRRAPTTIGWFSHKQALLGGAELWTTSSGQLIRCSFITRGDVPHGTGWSDIICLGEVFDFVCKAHFPVTVLYSPSTTKNPIGTRSKILPFEFC